jgi:predicted NAD-dependent protein-ADP-ribosyltransferase YbiA (DUF1768 family)
MERNPENDGVDHINVYSKGKTGLGRALSNFSHAPFDCVDGHFESVEGYWYWLTCTHPDRDKLRDVYGYQAKALGRELRGQDWPEETASFRRKVCAAILCKLKQNQWIFDKLDESNLPLVHYYVYGTKVVEPEAGKWQLEFLESIRGEE